LTSFLLRNGALLDPTRPDLLEGFEILIEDGFVREVSDKPIKSSNAHVIDVKGKTIMPGLIDLHVHVVAIEFNLPRVATLPNVLVTLRAVPIMRAMLRRGFTTVRDAGGAGYPFKQAVESGLIEGPRLFVSGRALSQTGGHADPRARSDYMPPDSPCGCCVRVGALGRVADGVDEVRRAVREELQMGADQIKIMASGGVASPTDPVGAFGYSEDEIRAIVAEAQGRGTYVLAHAYTPAAIARAVRCGVRTIEHGNLIDEETARLVAEHGAYVVPTLVTYDALASEGEKYGLPPASIAKVADVHGAGLHSIEIMKRAGVKMGFGTDLLGEAQRLQSDEFRILADVMSPAEVIASATIVGAEVLGMQDKLGRIMAGAHADVLVVDGNPLKSVDCLLGQGEHIPLVMKDGRIFVNELESA
jgi:imidazolonepropionase-like amidohydrolase